MSQTIAAPSVAERVHNSCRHADHATLAVPGFETVVTAVHHLRRNGTAIVAVPTTSPIAAIPGPAQVMVELTDNAPIPLREPVRCLVWLRGTLWNVSPGAQRPLSTTVATDYPHPALLDVGHTTALMRIDVESAVVADSTGAEPVDVDFLRTAEPDPFWEFESAWLQHLDTDHPDLVQSLTRRLPANLRRGRARPLAVDQYGLTLRIENRQGDGDRDIRLAFSRPARDVEALSRAVRALVDCPFRNGLHSR